MKWHRIFVFKEKYIWEQEQDQYFKTQGRREPIGSLFLCVETY